MQRLQPSVLVELLPTNIHEAIAGNIYILYVFSYSIITWSFLTYIN